MPHRVRRLEPRDKAAWLDLFRGYIDFYKADVPQAVIEATWQRMLTDAEALHIGLVAVDATDTPIGLAHVLLHRSTWSPTHYCYLEDLFVQPGLRAQGIGRALVAAVYAEADAAGATRTYWMTEDANYRARGLYDTLATKVPLVQYRRN